MKRIFTAILFILISLSASNTYAQKNLLKVEIENISLKMPDNWLISKTEKKMLDFKLLFYNQTNSNKISIHCIKKAVDEESAIINASSEKSLKPGFEYMIIEKVKTQKLNKLKGKFVEYTNSPLRDYYRGGFYGIVDNGYTYIIEYYSADTPEDRLEIEKVLKSINILKPESRPNFFEVEKIYLTENVATENPEEASLKQEENNPDQMDIDQGDITSEKTSQEKKSFWAKMSSVFRKKN
ncbi:MAG: hypothetical protein WCR29_00885 [Bacteroidales bacterium]